MSKYGFLSSRAQMQKSGVSVRPTTRPVHIDPIELCIFNKQEEKNWFRVRSSVLFVKSGRSKSTDLSIRGAKRRSWDHKEREGRRLFFKKVFAMHFRRLLKRPIWMKAKSNDSERCFVSEPEAFVLFFTWVTCMSCTERIFQLGALPPNSKSSSQIVLYIFILHCTCKCPRSFLVFPPKSNCFYIFILSKSQRMLLGNTTDHRDRRSVQYCISMPWYNEKKLRQQVV